MFKKVGGDVTENEYSFAIRLKGLRERRGLSQTDLGNIIGVNPNRLSNYEQGIRKPPIDILRLLCQGMGCSADELLGISGVMLDADELWCLEHYRTLGPERRRAIRDMIATLEGFVPADESSAPGDE